MIKTLLKYGILIIAGIVGYNYFLGDPAEKANSKKIVSEIKDVGSEIGSLIRSEREKFDKGKYDNALIKLKDVYDGLKQKAKNIDKKYLSKIDDLKERRNELENRLEDVTDDTTDDGKKQAKRIKKDLNKLWDETQDLMKEIE